MFTKYHNFFLSNRFFLNSPFQNKQTKPIRLQISLPCMSCRSFVCLRIHSFIPSFIHASMHSFIQVPGYTLHIKFLCQNFLQHNVVAWLGQLSWLQFSDNSFYFNTLLKTILVIWLCWWSYCRRWGEPRVISSFVPFVSVYQLPTSYYVKTQHLSEFGNSSKQSG